MTCCKISNHFEGKEVFKQGENLSSQLVFNDDNLVVVVGGVNMLIKTTKTRYENH